MAEATEDTRSMTITREVDGEQSTEIIAAKDMSPEQLNVFNKIEIVQNRKSQTINTAQFEVEILEAAETKFKTEFLATLEENDGNTEEAEFTETEE